MLKKILIGVVILAIVTVASMVLMVGYANKIKGSNEKILTSKNASPKKALIIFQPSLSDVTSLMANSIAKGLNDEGYEVTLNYPEKDLKYNISKYSIVIFGSPNYAGKPLTVVTDYMSKIKDLSSKKVIAFSTGADASKKDELEIMEKSLNGTKTYKKVKFLSSSKKESESKAYNLGKELSKE
ncbi:flavodoxin [Clostridium sp. P21]|uniref:Flavodoxin n=1 Tax=Clostridium muellerianum TaxID=2716538 RepID=A0A7Y0EED2_9CLOT|nr:flavodoxin domain-containing protein [Clostridium muellerianum]NMM61836.1 flavodoxin [Clostridium muellerianum]